MLALASVLLAPVVATFVPRAAGPCRGQRITGSRAMVDLSAGSNVDELLTVLEDRRSAGSRTVAERASIQELLISLESAGASETYDDSSLWGNYELAYFDRSIDGDRGSEAGGARKNGIRSSLLGALFSLRFSFQHLVAPDCCVNFVGFEFCGIPATVTTLGKLQRLDEGAVKAARLQAGTPLRFDTSVRIDFGKPRLSFGNGRLGPIFEFAAGQSPPVTLCTTYADERLRLARAAKGGRLVFTRSRLAEHPIAEGWRPVMERDPTSIPLAAAVAAAALAVGTISARALAALGAVGRRPVQAAALFGLAIVTVRIADAKRKWRALRKVAG